MKDITAWSFSRLKDFEQCPLKAYKKYVEKLSQDHMDRTAADRGTMVHTACENFVQGKGDFIKEMAKFRDYFADLKIKYEAGDVILEEDWGFTKDWEPTGWFDDNVWCRMKLDNFRVIERNDDGDPIVGAPSDYKTGKKYGNEVSHGQQGQIYAVGSFLRYPTLEVATVELIYLDHIHSKVQTLNRIIDHHIVPEICHGTHSGTCPVQYQVSSINDRISVLVYTYPLISDLVEELIVLIADIPPCNSPDTSRDIQEWMTSKLADILH